MEMALDAPPQFQTSQWSKSFYDGSAAVNMLNLADNTPERHAANTVGLDAN